MNYRAIILKKYHLILDNNNVARDKKCEQEHTIGIIQGGPSWGYMRNRLISRARGERDDVKHK